MEQLNLDECGLYHEMPTSRLMDDASPLRDIARKSDIKDVNIDNRRIIARKQGIKMVRSKLWPK